MSMVIAPIFVATPKRETEALLTGKADPYVTVSYSRFGKPVYAPKTLPSQPRLNLRFHR